MLFVYKQSEGQTVLFLIIQFSISHLFAICLNLKLFDDRKLSSPTTQGQSGPGSNVNEEVLHIPQSSIIIGASPSDYLMSYPEQ